MYILENCAKKPQLDGIRFFHIFSLNDESQQAEIGLSSHKVKSINSQSILVGYRNAFVGQLTCEQTEHPAQRLIENVNE